MAQVKCAAEKKNNKTEAAKKNKTDALKTSKDAAASGLDSVSYS